MTMILVTFYNLLIKTGYYPKRWIKLVDAILEKGKGPILGKLKTITLIEGDLQIMMRMYLNALEEELIKGDKRFSKANYSSKKNFSIETAILEKQLILDNSLLSLEKTIYNLTDLKSCCDRQLLNIGSIVEESVR